MNESQRLRVPTTGMSVDRSGCEVDNLSFCGAVEVRIGADEPWELLVDRAVGSGWAGIECLAGCPGTVADVVRDNAARYGQAVAETVASVRSWDRATDRQRTVPSAECGFESHSSRFQERLPDGSLRYEILDVTFLLRQADLSTPVQDAGLAAALSVRSGVRVPLAEVARAARR